ncbi:UPF0041 domain protein [Trichodelitschia bisporula]|uniref:Mitochondrial pyruvate carrier n=1 Tax=Trichodelitschia bisporula TaxID=703511 RepID=A0A6G1I7U8_9PEZI|nr:UPF0041 domain protein [Trichodelitschia bisporula]
MSQRVGLRLLRATQSFRATFRQPFQRRIQTDAAPEAAQSKLAALWASPVGPKTVHFWAPIMKWGVVIAGIADFARPAESLSLTQNLALVGTGAIWTRWCLIIRPKNVFLATVNFFLGVVGTIQVARIFLYQRSLKNQSLGESVKDAAKTQGHVAKEAVKHPEETIQKALK